MAIRGIHRSHIFREGADLRPRKPVPAELSNSGDMRKKPASGISESTTPVGIQPWDPLAWRSWTNQDQPHIAEAQAPLHDHLIIHRLHARDPYSIWEIGFYHPVSLLIGFHRYMARQGHLQHVQGNPKGCDAVEQSNGEHLTKIMQLRDVAAHRA